MLTNIRLLLFKIIARYFSEQEFNLSELEILNFLMKVNGFYSVYSKEVGLNLPLDNIVFPRAYC
jgi:hypothetical protein